MTEKQALEIIARHRGRVIIDHKAPEWCDEAGRECPYLVTLWLPSNFAVRGEGGGDTLVEAVKMAMNTIEEIRKERAHG
jgi:hypothetical protein